MSSNSSNVDSPVAASPPPPPSRKGVNGRKPSLVVQFKIPTEVLKKYSPPSTETVNSPAPSTSDPSVDSPAPTSSGPEVQISASSPSNSNADSTKPETPSKNGANGATKTPGTAGRKRATPGGSRLGPGPKKRKVDGQSPNSSLPTLTKFGPKTNAGAINANLRALDRTGAPCKRWTKSVFKLKSFTGVEWTIPAYEGERKSNTDSQSDVASVASAASPASNVETNGVMLMDGIESAMTPEMLVRQHESTPQPMVAPVG